MPRFLKTRMIKRGIFSIGTIFIVSALAIVSVAIQPVSSDDSQILFGAKLISKTLIMRSLDQYERLSGDAFYAPTPFDSPDFVYADLSDLYFERIKNDKRVEQFYAGWGSSQKAYRYTDFSDAVSMANFLRNLFPHGISRKDYLNTNVLELIDAAENGEQFLCGNISKMLAQLIQAGGTMARLISLGDPSDKGHVVVEMWSRRFNKWAVIDSDYNVHYRNSLGIPLSAWELYQIAQGENKVKDISRIAGKSPNTLRNSESKLIKNFYRSGFAIQFFNKWVDANLPRKHPARSPSIMSYYVGNS